MRWSKDDLKEMIPIGTGFFSTVFLLINPLTKEKFAVKKIQRRLLNEHRQVDGFENEIKILKLAKNCPFITKFYSLIKEANNYFIIMEYAEGSDLFHYSSGKLNIETVKFLSAQVLLALKFLHENGIIYNDLKPENVLITKEGNAMLSDFGVSIFEKDFYSEFGGTLEYMSPEKITGQSGTKMADYWAFGCLIFEMLFGYPPFGCGLSRQEMLEKINNNGLVIPENIMKEAKDLIFKLLIRVKENRLGKNGIQEIMNHPFYKGIDWELLQSGKLKSPLIPDLKIPTELGKLPDEYKDNPEKIVFRRIIRMKLKK